MSQQTSPSTRMWAEGIGIFAGATLLIVGLFQLMEGIAAAAKDDVFVTTNNYVFSFDLTTWGWIHIVVGALAAIVGGALLAGQRWALGAGIVLAIVSALMNFVWMPYYPFWALLIIAIDIAVIWALSTLLSSQRQWAGSKA